MENDNPQPDADLPPVVNPTSPEPPADPAPTVEPEDGQLAGIEQAIEHAAEAVVDEVKSVIHTIEHRTFGRPSADHPVVVTSHTGN